MAPCSPVDRRRSTARIEWPTLAVAGAIYSAFALLTLCHDQLPWPVTAALAGFVVAWHGSLQHEVIHGHPTPWARANSLMVLPCLWLWLPLACYHRDHLRHHQDRHLTDPRHDPESWYVPAGRWRRLGARRRALRELLDTSAGRLLLGPWLVMAGSVTRTGVALARGQVTPGDAAFHVTGVALVLFWVMAVCDIAPLDYLLLYVYPGTALTLLRSFAEHRAAGDPAQLTCEVRSNALMSLLYLNNNLHRTHHAAPALPWYALPGRWREQHARSPVDGRRVFDGYWHVIRRSLVSPHIRQPWNPAAPTA
jgi:fatty acid desaturase